MQAAHHVRSVDVFARMAGGAALDFQAEAGIAGGERVSNRSDVQIIRIVVGIAVVTVLLLLRGGVAIQGSKVHGQRRGKSE